MISVIDYDKVQIILGRKGNPRPQKHSFTYGCIIKCGECGCSVVGDPKTKILKGGTTKVYMLYHCTHKKKSLKCKERSISEENIEIEILRNLNSIYIPQSYIDWGIAQLREKLKQTTSSTNEELNALNVKILEVKFKLQNLIDDEMSKLSQFDKEDIEEAKERYVKERKMLREQINQLEKSHDDSIDETLEFADFCKRAAYEFENGDRHKKREIFLKLGSHFTLKDRKLTINLKKSLFRLKEELDTYRAEFSGLSPMGIVDLKEQLPPIEAVSTRFLGNQDSNLDACFQRAMNCHYSIPQ